MAAIQEQEACQVVPANLVEHLIGLVARKKKMKKLTINLMMKQLFSDIQSNVNEQLPAVVDLALGLVVLVAVSMVQLKLTVVAVELAVAMFASVVPVNVACLQQSAEQMDAIVLALENVAANERNTIIYSFIFLSNIKY